MILWLVKKTTYYDSKFCLSYWSTIFFNMFYSCPKKSSYFNVLFSRYMNMYLTIASEIKKNLHFNLFFAIYVFAFPRYIAIELFLNDVKFYLLETILTTSHGLMNQNSFAETLQIISFLFSQLNVSMKMSIYIWNII